MSPREASRKGEGTRCPRVGKLIILEKNARFTARSDSVGNIMLTPVKWEYPLYHSLRPSQALGE